MDRLYLEIVSPEKILVSQEVDMVIAPGSEGEFGVLPGHIHFLSGIVPGELRYTSGDETEYMAVTTGFAEVSDNKVSILVDAAEKSSHIDIKRARDAIARSKERLAMDKGTQDIDSMRAEIAMQRAAARIKVAEKTK